MKRGVTLQEHLCPHVTSLQQLFSAPRSEAWTHPTNVCVCVCEPRNDGNTSVSVISQIMMKGTNPNPPPTHPPRSTSDQEDMAREFPTGGRQEAPHSGAVPCDPGERNREVRGGTTLCHPVIVRLTFDLWAQRLHRGIYQSQGRGDVHVRRLQ